MSQSYTFEDYLEQNETDILMTQWSDEHSVLSEKVEKTITNNPDLLQQIVLSMNAEDLGKVMDKVRSEAWDNWVARGEAASEAYND